MSIALVWNEWSAISATRSPLEQVLEAARAGDIARVRELVDKEPRLVSSRGALGESPILVAAYSCAHHVAELLVARGAKLDIFEATALGQDERVRELLQTDANLVNLHCFDGWMPLHLAAYFGHPTVAADLLSHVAPLQARARNGSGHTPLHSAVAGRQSRLVQLLLRAGADPNAVAGDGWTPLHLAADEGLSEIGRILLDHGANVNSQRDDGATPLMVGLIAGHLPAIALLRSRGGRLWR